MKKLYSLLLVLCLAAVISAQAVKDMCGGNSTCDDGLICEYNRCRILIDLNCTSQSTDECVRTASVCTHDGKCICPTGSIANDDKTMCKCVEATHAVSNKRCVSKSGEQCMDSAFCIANAECISNRCECTDNFVSSEDRTICLRNAGQKCVADAQCLPGATCKEDSNGEKKCTCGPGTVPNAEMRKCVSHSGGPCEEDEDCLTHAVCFYDKRCRCEKGYLASHGNDMCKKEVGQECSVDDYECGFNAECKNYQCECRSGFSSKLGEICGMKVDQACSNHTNCVKHAECIDNKCKCLEDAEELSDKYCAGASAMVASVLLLSAAFVGTRWI